MFVAGTRPEALKLAPVIRAVALEPGLRVRVCAAAQRRALLDSALAEFGIVADDDFDLMQTAQTPAGVVAAVMGALMPVLAAEPPAAIVVQGDTATSFGAALAGGYARLPVAHVEAGLRSGDDESFPEEMHRRGIAQIASLHFAPTPTARAALLSEGVEATHIYVPGNTAIDALHMTAQRTQADPALALRLASAFAAIDPARPLVLGTVHRRENHGARLQSIRNALRELAQHGAEVGLPVHPHPAVAPHVARMLGGRPHVHLLPPLDHASFVWLLRRARLVLTDSGGVQDEAPALGVPVLVLRDSTERPEGVAAGVAMLVGAERSRIVAAARVLIEDDLAHARMSRAVLPYGDGRASQRIAHVLAAAFGAGAALPARRAAAVDPG